MIHDTLHIHKILVKVNLFKNNNIKKYRLNLNKIS